MAETAEAVEEKAQEGQEQQNDAGQADSKTQVQSVELSEATGAEATGAGGSIEILLDMNIPVTVAIGKKDMSVRRLLQLGPNSVVKLDKSIDAPADLYLKDTRFATGNVVVVDGQFAVKIKEIIGLSDSKTEQADG
ncbi:MAG: FliM/FliN family flagellar motor switch protein [Planctomycetota bacterium]|jgi:flagellar motor switch protein FliN/FliY